MPKLNSLNGMNIAGVQALSLIDYPEKPCSIIFTQGCVFRCSYCHNPDLIPLDAPSVAKTADEVIEFLSKRASFVDAVCITGGEPTLQTGLEEFIVRLKDIGLSVKLDTNGIRPDIISRLLEKKLVDYIAMDLKHRWEEYPAVIRISNQGIIDRCKETFPLIQSSGVPHEFRTTIMPGVHTREDFFSIAGQLVPGERYYIQKTVTKKTLEPLTGICEFDVVELVKDLQGTFSHLIIGCR
ncbi:MAG: anaerobic ribonucleoside-triphosphate reductase activating protein [Candidatus Uhrbacteria bacterium]|nr:anaerobic ribonucleoside-triphosphate reductase activating protein [Candidatus Uhrbacteria bacterium]